MMLSSAHQVSEAPMQMNIAQLYKQNVLDLPIDLLDAPPTNMFKYGKQRSLAMPDFNAPPELRKSKTLPEASSRVACKTPFKILDAPNLQDDFYLNLVDWSSQNMLAVALNNSVYLWNGENNKVSKLLENT